MHRGRGGGAGPLPQTGDLQYGSGVAVHSIHFATVLLARDIEISMDGKGAWRDNIFVERLWNSVKDEEVCLRAYETISHERASIGRYLDFYNGRRSDSLLGGKTLDQIYFNQPILAAAQTRQTIHLSSRRGCSKTNRAISLLIEHNDVNIHCVPVAENSSSQRCHDHSLLHVNQSSPKQANSSRVPAGSAVCKTHDASWSYWPAPSRCLSVRRTAQTSCTADGGSPSTPWRGLCLSRLCAARSDRNEEYTEDLKWLASIR
ncbi:transposase [Aurantimonas sp. 22II-16-19i]|nr:transposase [Aurantimonas sp. 22II-16-19i]